MTKYKVFKGRGCIADMWLDAEGAARMTALGYRLVAL